MSSKSKKRKTYNIIIILLLIILCAMVGFLAYAILKDKSQAGSSAHVDSEATAWDDGIDNNSEIEGKILVPGYSGAKMKCGDKTLALRIGNPSENTCYLQATLLLEDGTVLYESDLLEPGTGYDTIEITQTLEVGEYNAYVHYQGYSMEETPEMLNSCDSAFVLKVTE